MLQLVDHGTHVGQDDDDDEDDDRHPQQQHHAEVEDHGEDDHRQYRATCQQELSSAQTPPFVRTKGVNEIHNRWSQINYEIEISSIPILTTHIFIVTQGCVETYEHCGHSSARGLGLEHLEL